MVGKRHDDSYINQILQKYYSQYTDEELLKLYNIDKDTIRRCRRKFNLRRCNRKINFDIAEKYGLNAADLSRDYVINPLNIENKDLPEIEDVRIMFEDYKMNNADIAHFFSMDSHFIKEITDNFTPNYIRPKKVIDYINEDPELPNKVKELRDAGFKNLEILKKLNIPGSCLNYIVRNYDLYKDDEAGDIHALDGYDIDFSKLSRDYIKNPLYMRINGKVNREFPTKEDFLYLFKEKNVRREDICKYFKISDSLINAILKEYNIEGKTSEEKRENYLREIRKNYNIDNVFQIESVKEKSKITMKKRYGEIYQKTDEYVQKVKATKLERYGNENYVNVDKLRKTCMEKYGVDAIAQKNWSDKTKNVLKSKESFQQYLKDKSNWSKRELKEDLDISYSTINRFIRKFNLQDQISFGGSDITNKSSYESEIMRLFSNQFEQSNRSILYRENRQSLEIDLYNKEHNFGIEINGAYWHSEFSKGNPFACRDKSRLATERDTFIFHIWDFEWDNKDKKPILISMIKNLLGQNDKIIYGRNTEIKIIDSDVANHFLDKNHLQGRDNASVRLGLFYENELVSLMTFKNPRFNKHYQYELSRFCNKINTTVIGAASKLFNYFITAFKPESIISYSNNAKTKGSLYEKLGFTFLNDSHPNYWWCGNNKVLSRYQCQKAKLVAEGADPNKTEIQIMHDLDFFRVYDCGNKVWVWKR